MEGAGDANTDACLIATSVKDDSGAPPSIRPTTDMTTCTDNGSGYTASTYEGEDMIRRTLP